MRASLIHMFGQTLRSFELAHAASPTHSHNLSWAHVPSNSYSLTVVVHITDQELATRNFKMDWINEVAIGPYEPNFSSEVDIAKQCHIIVLRYNTNDLDHFIHELCEKAWKDYDEKASALIDKIINDGT